MGSKIFVSYKYGDILVRPLPAKLFTTARHYVNEFQSKIGQTDEIFKGEDDGVDLSDFADDTIASKLRDKIYDSSITVVFISKGMKDLATPEKDQWIPWELSYSLRESTRAGRTSRANGILAVVLPDESNSYSYYILEDSCPHCHCRTLKTHTLFQILHDNMFNIKDPKYNGCKHHNAAGKVYTGNSSYIRSVKWDDFIDSVKNNIEITSNLAENINQYDVTKNLT
jgi:hypothetical protein